MCILHHCLDEKLVLCDDYGEAKLAESVDASGALYTIGKKEPYIKSNGAFPSVWIDHKSLQKYLNKNIGHDGLFLWFFVTVVAILAKKLVYLTESNAFIQILLLVLLPFFFFFDNLIVGDGGFEP